MTFYLHTIFLQPYAVLPSTVPTPAAIGSGNIVIIIAVVSATILILLGCIFVAVVSGVICRRRYTTDSFGAGYRAVLSSCIQYRVCIHSNNLADVINMKTRASMTALLHTCNLTQDS